MNVVLPHPRATASRRPRPVLFALLGLTACADAGPSAPSELPLEIVVVAGDGQVALPGAELPEPLILEVRARGGGPGAPGRRVLLEPTQGSGLRILPTEALTDATGRARVRLRLGVVPGPYGVRARLEGGAMAEAAALAVAAPRLDALSATAAPAGGTLVLTGAALWSPAGGRVEVGGLRGRVLDAEQDRLEIEVPPCLPALSAEVRVHGATGVSAPLPLEVTAAAALPRLAVGESRTLGPGDAQSCVGVGLGAGDEVLVQVTSTQAEVTGPVPFVLVGAGLPRTGTGTTVLTAPPRGSARRPGGIVPAPAGLRDRLARLEATAAHSGGTAPVGKGPPARTPALGESRTFDVVRADGTFEPVEAEVRHVAEHAVFYAEVGASELPVGDSAWGVLAGLFDGPIWEVDRSLYGDVPDLDGNGRVALLFTGAVNGLSAPGGQGRVGGFFFGVDLLPGRPGSNEGEVLYLIRPDPDGRDGPPIARSEVLEGVPAVIAHELQHLIHFHERMRVRAAAGTEATWLSEGLAVMAEDRVALHLEQAGDLAGRDRFQRGNRVRGRDYLRDPSTVSLIITQGAGTVEERGGAWLFLRYLTERYGTRVLGELTRTTERGTRNVEQVTGILWAEALGDWGVALAADGVPGLPPRYGYPVLDVGAAVGGAPRIPIPLVGERTHVPLTLRPSSLAHLVLSGDEVSEIALGLSGDEGGAPPASAAVQLRVVRLR
ncbi:MAG: hypothetical protein R3E98_06010 [Gemmatimonadota bacterium]